MGDVQDDRFVLDRVETIRVEQNVKTDKHLLRAEDVLVAARSTMIKAALVPPLAEPTAADASLLVVTPDEALPDLGPLLWWYLTSRIGKSRLDARMVGSTVLALPAASLAELEVLLPDARTMRLIASLVDASERAYRAAVEAAAVRRALFRDDLVDRLLRSGR